MTVKKFLFQFAVLFFASAILYGCGGKRAEVASNSFDGPIYTRYNIHVQEQARRNGDLVYRASYANYTDPGSGHIIIPAGSKIEITKTNRKEFNFRVPEKDIEVAFEYHEPRMGMSVGEYIKKITSEAPVSTADLSKTDRQGIAEGKALVGMSREGVMTALGYPAAHRTPSLDASTYVYWTNRFKTVGVDFDANGKVKNVTN